MGKHAKTIPTPSPADLRKLMDQIGELVLALPGCDPVLDGDCDEVIGRMADGSDVRITISHDPAED